MFDKLPLAPADILLPTGCDLTKWSVVACDQYTSQPEYWARVGHTVGNAPSTLHLTLPESSLDGPNVETDILEINNTMSRYLRDEVFASVPNAMIYVERTLENGQKRHGLMAKVDLEAYDYEPGATTLIRATEGTVLSRIPPRVAVRKNANIELPHVMLLADDPEKSVIEPLIAQTGEMKALYDFDLMEHSGHIRGWQLTGQQMANVATALTALAQPEHFEAKYNAPGKPVLLFAAGDGNHSLATAKECYERQKRITPQEQWADLPARYALVELVNLHDDSLVFEPIHRVLFGVDPEALLTDLMAAYPGAHQGIGEGHALGYFHANGTGTITVPNPTHQLEVGTLQLFLDSWLETHPGTIDYIHGDDVLRDLSSRTGALGFSLPPMSKDALFPTVIFDAVLPRKTFSMGDAQDKRFYLEARKIR